MARHGEADAAGAVIYLDYQATTPLAPEALAAMLPWLADQHANPHSPHRPGRAAKAAVEVARAQVAALLPPGGRVVFTSGATEALNWAIKGTQGAIVTLATEHAAVLDTVRASVVTGWLRQRMRRLRVGWSRRCSSTMRSVWCNRSPSSPRGRMPGLR